MRHAEFAADQQCQRVVVPHQVHLVRRDGLGLQEQRSKVHLGRGLARGIGGGGGGEEARGRGGEEGFVGGFFGGGGGMLLLLMLLLVGG